MPLVVERHQLEEQDEYVGGFSRIHVPLSGQLSASGTAFIKHNTTSY